MEVNEILGGVFNYVAHQIPHKPFQPCKDEVPVSGSRLSPADITRIVECALSGWVTEGQQCAEFEKKLKVFSKQRHVVLTNSGSSANLLALNAIIEKFKLHRNYLVVTSATAFQTTVAPIIQMGMIPYFVDVDWTTLNPNPDDLMRVADKESVAGLMLAHTLGFPIKDMNKVIERYHFFGKFVIEDCCDAFGAYNDDGYPVGYKADAMTLSFFPAHQITTGEGGAVLTQDGKLFSLLRSYRNWGRDCWCKPGEENACGRRFDWEFPNLPPHYDHKYIVSRLGYNLRMTDLQASIGNSQMDRITEIISHRLSNYYYLLEGFCSLPHFFDTFYVVREQRGKEFTASPFGLPILCLRSVVRRDEIVRFLESRKIRSRPMFTGNITRQPMMEHPSYMQRGTLDGANDVMETGFWIGCHPELSLEQLDFVIQSFGDFLTKLWTE